MPKRIMSLVFASLVAGIPITTVSSRAAPTSESCVPAPQGAPPEGRHWYYHMDGEAHRKCWYLGPQGAKARHVVATKPDRVAKPIPAPPPEPAAAQPMPMVPIEAVPGPFRPADVAASRQNDPPVAAAVSDGEPTATGASSEAPPMSETIAMPSPHPAAARLAAVEQPVAFAVDWKLLLALLAGALALAAVIGRALFRQPAAPRRRRPDFLERPDVAWTAPRAAERIVAEASLLQFREISIAPELEEASIGRDARSDRAPSEPVDPSEEIEALLRRLEQARERTAA
jgi:hypothetical protein